MKKILLLLAAGLMVSAFISGCGTEDPWNPNPTFDLDLAIVSGPADTVAYGANVSFTWTSQGGIGEVEYQYRLGSGSWSEWSNITSVTYADRTAGAIFEVQARDEGNQTDSETREFFVGSASGADTDAPIVRIIDSPNRGSYVATGSNISFTWAGEDAVDGDNLLYWYYWDGMMSADTTSTTTISFEDVLPSDAEFIVWATDQSGNVSVPASDSTWWLDGVPHPTLIEGADSVHVDTSVYFTILDATILYIDDYQWIDAVTGGVDMVKERDQKQFYRDALAGYAFAEWDWAEDDIPDSSDLVVGGEPVYSTIVFASDGLLDDASGTWPWMWNSIPPAAGDLEFDYFGVDSVESDIIDEADSTWWLGDSAYTEPVLLPDSITVEYTYFNAWESEWWFTWAIKDENTMLSLPDSMKLDVAKNGDQDDYATTVLSLRDEPSVRTEVIFNWGLWVDNDPPATPYYMNPVGHITSLNSGQQYTAMLNFDTYSMPLPLIRQTFQAILSEFGE
jgi:hypothetical protein